MPQVRMILALGLALSAAAPGGAETRRLPQDSIPEPVSVTGLRYTESSSSIRVEVETNRPPTFTRGEAANPPRAYIDIENARVGADLHNSVVPVGSKALERIRIAQHDRDTVRVVLDLTPTSALSTFSVLEDPWRLVVDVVSLAEEGDAAEEPDETHEPAAAPAGKAPATEQPAAPAPAADTIASLEIGMIGTRVSMHARDVALGELLARLDSVAGTRSTIAPGLESYRVDIWVDDLPVDQAIGKLFAGRPIDYAVVGGRIVVLGMAGEGAPFVPDLPPPPPVPEAPTAPPTAVRPTCLLRAQGSQYAVGDTPSLGDAVYLCASLLVEDAAPPRAAWVRMESSDAGLAIPNPASSGSPCTLRESLSYAVGSVVLQEGTVYRCVPVLDDNLDPAGTAWVTTDESAN